VLKNTPLYVLLFPELAVPIDPCRLKSIHQQSRGLFEKVKTVVQFPGSKRVATVNCGIQRRAAGFALVVLVLTSEEQEGIWIRVRQSCHVFDQLAEP
jgi:hypothetical protein